MVLISEESKSCPEFQQKLCHISNESLFDITFNNIRFEWNKVEYIWIFHHLCGQITLGRRKSGGKVRYFFRECLLAIQICFNLMYQHIM